MIKTLKIICLVLTILILFLVLYILRENYFGAYNENSSYHAGMYQVNNTTTTVISTVSTWTDIGNFVQGNADGWTFNSASSTLTTGKSRRMYLAVYSVSAQSALANKDYEVGVAINGTVQNNCISERNFSNTALGNLGSPCFIAVNPNDVVNLRVLNETDDTDIVVKYANLVLIEH